jgi:hypothetical protein
VQLIQKPFCILARLYADDVKWKQLLGQNGLKWRLHGIVYTLVPKETATAIQSRTPDKYWLYSCIGRTSFWIISKANENKQQRHSWIEIASAHFKFNADGRWKWNVLKKAMAYTVDPISYLFPWPFTYNSHSLSLSQVFWVLTHTDASPSLGRPRTSSSWKLGTNIFWISRISVFGQKGDNQNWVLGRERC